MMLGLPEKHARFSSQLTIEKGDFFAKVNECRKQNKVTQYVMISIDRLVYLSTLENRFVFCTFQHHFLADTDKHQFDFCVSVMNSFLVRFTINSQTQKHDSRTRKSVRKTPFTKFLREKLTHFH
jgi:hypothetical protein